MTLKRPLHALSCLLVVGAWLAAAGPSRAEVTVFAAASLKTALDSAVAASGIDATVSYAGSSVLARQVQLGAPADIFLSANADWMDVLEEDGRLAAATRRDLLGNSLVVIAHDAGAAVADLSDLPDALGEGRLAMALVTAVPAGIYGKAALETADVWPALAPQVAQADNVRAALALVATGAAPFGIVYATDARAEPRVHVVLEIPPESHGAIIYPIARIDGREGTAAQALYTYLTGPEGAAHFAAQGFDVLTE